ncbi:MAG: hypothetical protein E4G96_00350 [Chrysiogenales bacterium]|nr:MAG: hypothetical protein E4G96_00350 [Chrysiogenales bacterium]
MKRYNIGMLLASLVIPAMVAGVNYFMDPLWCFDISHAYNQYQDGFNERLQKTNYITFRDIDYQGVLIGTSRSTPINQSSFKDITVFNYAANGLTVEEYPAYLKYFTRRNKSAVRYIFIGLDFDLTHNVTPIQQDLKLENLRIMNPAIVIANANNPLNRLKTLISIDTLKYSYKNYVFYRRGANFLYDRNANKMNAKISKDKVARIVEVYMSYYEKNINLTYHYDDSYKKMLSKIQGDNPSAIIIPYTTPVIDPLMDLISKNELADNYYRWLEEIVDTFGFCYHFMHPSLITREYYKYFVDPVHPNTILGMLMADVMLDRGSRNDGEFGMYIDRRNINQKIRQLKIMLNQR